MRSSSQLASAPYSTARSQNRWRGSLARHASRRSTTAQRPDAAAAARSVGRARSGPSGPHRSGVSCPRSPTRRPRSSSRAHPTQRIARREHRAGFPHEPVLADLFGRTTRGMGRCSPCDHVLAPHLQRDGAANPAETDSKGPLCDAERVLD
jgi:hypothetical protein